MPALGWCRDAITVAPARVAICFMYCITVSAAKLSSPEVGSSRNTTEGADRIWIAMLSRLRSPPESPRRLVPLYWITPPTCRWQNAMVRLVSLNQCMPLLQRQFRRVDTTGACVLKILVLPIGSSGNSSALTAYVVHQPDVT
jgi:hypothetical protein